MTKPVRGAGVPRSVRRLALAAYALLLVAMTHWPALQVPEVAPRSDLWVHFAAFGLLMLLAAAGAFFGPVFAPRNIAICSLACLVFAAVDESTQAIPALRRHAGFDDYAANAGGILLATLGLLALSRAFHARSRA